MQLDRCNRTNGPVQLEKNMLSLDGYLRQEMFYDVMRVWMTRPCNRKYSY